MRTLAATIDHACSDHIRRDPVTRDYVSRRRQLLLMVAVYLVAIAVAATATAQRPSARDAKLKPRVENLKTKDGVNLRAMYFPSNKGKEAITVLLIHQWRGQASPYRKLAEALSKNGCAVLVPDYRGHGGSSEYINARGQKDKFNVSQMSRRDVENIIRFDLETAKAFLKEENNEGNLNLNALVVIGVREGCVIGAHWTQRDWSFPSVGAMKQGQDVKAVIAVSPTKQVKGIGVDPILSDQVIVRLPIMIVAGAKSPEASEARRIGKRIEGIKTRLGRGTPSGYELKLYPTKLSSHSLINGVPSVAASILKFIKTEVDPSEANPWVKRD